MIGSLAALAFAGALRALLFEVSATDAPTFVLAAAALGAMTLFAAWLPARGAARVPPNEVLRG